MVIIDSLENIPQIPNAVVTSGTFDGVHFGHEKILRDVVRTAHSIQGKSVVLTFWPHPRFILSPNGNGLKLLSTFEEKAELMEGLGIDYIVKVKFTKAFSELSSEEFVQDVVVDKLRTKKLIIGYDHRFGKNREGSFEYLQENAERFGFEVSEISRQDIDDVGVSSTKIRNSLNNGEVHLASEYMGRPYEIRGEVQEGQHLGKAIGFPTANLHVFESYKLIPKDGVYAVEVKTADKWLGGMLNIGNRPTVEGAGRAMEVNIFDFDKTIYGEQIKVRFIKRLRDEIKFESLDELKGQLEKDKIAASAALKNNRS